MQNLLAQQKKTIDEVDPVTETFIDILSGKHKLMVHLHMEDDAMILIQLANEFGLKVVANHCVDIHRQEAFSVLRDASIPIIYGAMDSLPYKVELKNESWKNAEKLLNSQAKFSMMSDHPVILQRNMFYTLRHLLRFGISKSKAISKIISEAAEIIGASDIGQVKQGFKASLVVWNGDPFTLTSYPILEIGEGKILYKE